MLKSKPGFSFRAAKRSGPWIGNPMAINSLFSCPQENTLNSQFPTLIKMTKATFSKSKGAKRVASWEEEARRFIELVNKIAEELGLPVARHKVQVSQRLTYLGIVFDSRTMTMSIDAEVARSKLLDLEERYIPWVLNDLTDHLGRPHLIRLDSLFE